MTIVSRIGGQGVSELLLESWRRLDTSAKVRAASVLGEAQVMEVVPLLIGALRDPDVELRATAASWLGVDGRAVQPLA